MWAGQGRAAARLRGPRLLTVIHRPRQERRDAARHDIALRVRNAAEAQVLK